MFWICLLIFVGINIAAQQAAMMLFADATNFNPLVMSSALFQLTDSIWLFPPFSFTAAWIKFHSVAPVLLKTPTIIAGIGFLISLVSAIGLPVFVSDPSRRRTSSGSAHWATYSNIKSKGLLAKKVGEKEGTIIGCWDVGGNYETQFKFAQKLAKKLLNLFPDNFRKYKPDQLAWRIMKFLPAHRYYIVDNEKTHLLICAPSRSGKGIGAVIPTLLNWKDSCVVSDPKRENLDITGGYREKVLGHKVVEFAPTDLRKTYRFNLVNEIRWGTPMEGRDVANVVDTLVGKGSGNDAHWIQNAKSLIIGVLTHLKYKHEVENNISDVRPGMEGYRETNMYDVYEYLSTLKDVNDEEGFSGIAAKIKEDLDSTQHFPVTLHIPNRTSRLPWLDLYVDTKRAETITHWTPEAKAKGYQHPVVAASFGSFLSKPPNEAGSVVSTAVTALQIFSEKIIVDNTCTSDFFLTDLQNLEEPMDLFLVVPPSDLQRVGPLFRLIVEMTVVKSTERLVDKPKHRCLFLIDEFPAFGRMDNLVAELGYIAGYGLKTMIIVQGLEQIKERYKSMELLTNCQTQVFFGPNDQTTRNYLSELLGNQTIVVKSVSHNAGFFSKRNISENEKERRLLTPDETSSRLSNDSAMVIEGLKILSPKNKYFIMQDMQECIAKGKALTKGQVGLRPASVNH